MLGYTGRRIREGEGGGGNRKRRFQAGRRGRVGFRLARQSAPAGNAGAEIRILEATRHEGAADCGGTRRRSYRRVKHLGLS